MGTPLFVLLALFPRLALAQFPSGSAVIEPEDLTQYFDVPAGLKVTLWAKTPLLYNPTAIDVDKHNRVWVAEGVNYRKWNGRNPGLSRPEGDRIMILEDGDWAGVCSRSKVFAQDKDLVAPLGIAVYGGWIFVSCSPAIYIYQDVDADDVPDNRSVFLTGFGGHDHDHGVHSVVVGPDLRIYAAVGNAGPHLVTDRAGFNLRSGSLYRDGGEFLTDNRPGLVSDDGRVWTGGLLLRADVDARNLTVVAHNFRNEYEVALDSFGNMFTEDNDDDGNQSCRTVWCMEGGNYGYFSADGSRYWSADKRPGQSTQAAHWHQDDPGVLPAGSINGGGGPTGVTVYESDVLGAQFDGVIFDADAGRNCIWMHRPVAKGAGIELERSVFLAPKAGAAGGEKANWFRPSDVCVAPDGTLYIADWWDPGVGGHGMADKEGFGRILRVVPQGRWIYPAHVELNTVGAGMTALENPAVHVRAEAARALHDRGDRAVPALQAMMERASPRMRARALWLLSMTRTGADAAFAKAFQDLEPDVRVAAIRAWRAPEAKRGDVLALVPKLASDPSPAVRRELLIGLRDIPFERSRDALIQLARGYDGTDRYYLEAFGIGASGKEEALWPALVDAMNGKDPLAWTPSLAGLAWRLHPQSALAALETRAKRAALPVEARKQAIDAIAFVKDRAAGEAMLNLALGGPEDLRAYAAWWVRNRDTNDWSQWRLARELGSDAAGGDEFAANDAAKLVWKSGIVKKGAVDLEVDLGSAKKLWLVVTEGEHGNSCDWADWLEPKLLDAQGFGARIGIPLATLPWSSAKAGWGEVHAGKNCNGDALVVDGKKYTDGIGTHARSVIAYDLPAGAWHLTAKPAVDDGGSLQPSHASEVEFQVWIDSTVDHARLRALAQPLMEPTARPEAIESAARTLATDKDGGQELLRLAAEEKLTPAAMHAVAAVIFQSPDIGVRGIASQYFERPAASGKPLPPVSKLLELEGSAQRGQKIFFDKKAACSTCHTFHGRGGEIGPDLSAIRQKYKAPELLDAILNPSASIAFGYDAWLVETKDEEIFSGFILADGETLVIKDTTGKRHVIPAAEVASRKKQKASLMPDNAAMGLEPEELADLVAFLGSDPTAPGKRGEPIPLFGATAEKAFDGWVFHSDEDPTKKLADVFTWKDGVVRDEGHPIGYLRTTKDYENYVIELDWRFDPKRGPGNSGVLMRMTGKDKVWPKSVEAQLENRNAGDIWNIDEVPMQVERSRTSGRHTEKAKPCNEKPLGEWNHYKITLDGGELTLEVNGEVQNHAAWVEEVPGKLLLQAEGAYIEFRNVTLTPIERTP